MPNPIEQELGLGPVAHRVRRWVKGRASKLGLSLAQEGTATLDPLTVNYAAWDAVRKHTREWPTYREAPNSIEVYVSPEDWEDYWGINTDRKEENVAAYVAQRATDKGLFLAGGSPQVVVLADDGLDMGELDVSCQFVEADDAGGSDSASHTAEHEALPDKPDFEPAEAGKAAVLMGEGGFCLTVHSGDCIGAVRQGDLVAPGVNIRLDANGFPYVAAKQCTLGIHDGQWMVQNHSAHGTQIITAGGERLMLLVPSPYPLQAGDVLCFGPARPLRFEPRHRR